MKDCQQENNRQWLKTDTELKHQARNFNSALLKISERFRDTVSSQQLDERLAMAIEPIWETVSELPTETKQGEAQAQPKKPSKKSTNQELTEDQDNKLLEIALNEEYWKETFYKCNHKEIASAISNALINAGFKNEDYSLSDNRIRAWLKSNERPTQGKNYLAARLFDKILDVIEFDSIWFKSSDS